MMTSNEIRRLFLEYFQQQGHTIVASSPLIPGNDPTLLFTNAGMVQFKDVFLGLDKRSYKRAASAQRCVRAGGKHNDLENVGHTARHHTLFEMLGNFSFGDYFKREAIQFAWEFLTGVLKIPAEKLWVTVYKEDDEAADIWLKEIKVDPERFSRCDAQDNFWAMGDTGPCGPCTEIYYDHGPEIPGGPPGTPEADGDRYIELWNLVFMQYERLPGGELKPLPNPSVDTGMGLERVSAVMQGVHNNYDTDLFRGLIVEIAKLAKSNDHTNTSMRVIADHIRSCSFLIADGILPSNEGRGYVLRRIIRRAIRHGYKLGLQDAFFHKLVTPLVTQMGGAYPELVKLQSHIERVLLQEEQQFARTLDKGLKLLEQDIAALKTNKTIAGVTVFKLYDTYGFPVDLTADIARERGLALDLAGFEQEMEKQRRQSQVMSHFNVDYTDRLNAIADTVFTGYEKLVHPAKILALLDMETKNKLDVLTETQQAVIVLDETPFYAESGGQVGDQGKLFNAHANFEVTHTEKTGNIYLHCGRVTQGKLQIGDTLTAQVDAAKRRATTLNHSATHLLHAALRQILGEHVMQKGSLVEPERLRFDFTHYAAMTEEELKAVELLVNQKIRENFPVETDVMSPQQAQEKGALAFFGEKYGEQVRVLTMSEFSKELCGGTHVKRSGDIGLFKIISESGISAGVRRMEAITGEYAVQWLQNFIAKTEQAARLLKTNKEALVEKIEKTIEHTQKIEKQLTQLQDKLAQNVGQELAAKAQQIKDVYVLVAQMEGAEVKNLRELADQLRSKWPAAIVVLGCQHVEQAHLIIAVSKSLTGKLPANQLVNQISAAINGKGGGRPDLAQAGGNNPEGLKQALQKAQQIINEALA